MKRSRRGCILWKQREGVGGSGKCPESSSRIGSRCPFNHLVCNWQVTGALLRAIAVGGQQLTCSDLQYKFKVELAKKKKWCSLLLQETRL